MVDRIVEIRRRMTARSIEHNPAEIELTRVTTENDGAGGVTKEETTADSQQFRIYMSRDQVQDVVQEGGLKQITRWGLLAFHDADIQVGDTFSYESGQFRIKSIRTLRVSGHAISKQVQLEKVG